MYGKVQTTITRYGITNISQLKLYTQKGQKCL